MIKCYMVKGIGNVIAEEVDKGKEGVMVDYPALAIHVPLADGSGTWALESLIPAFISNASSVARKMKIPYRDILFEGKPDKSMVRTYTKFQKAVIQAFSGLILPKQVPKELTVVGKRAD